MTAWLSAAAGAIATGVFAVLMWVLNRNAAKHDKAEEKKAAEEKAEAKKVMEQFRAGIEKLDSFAAELGIIKADVIMLKESNLRQDEERRRDKAYDARRRILRFADEVRRGERHSLEHFNNVFADINNYNQYCDMHPDFENDKATVSIKCIRQVYEQCTLDNSFL